MENFRILSFAEVTFLIPEHFPPIFNLNDVMKRFCDVNTLT